MYSLQTSSEARLCTAFEDHIHSRLTSWYDTSAKVSAIAANEHPMPRTCVAAIKHPPSRLWAVQRGLRVVDHGTSDHFKALEGAPETVILQGKQERRPPEGIVATHHSQRGCTSAVCGSTVRYILVDVASSVALRHLAPSSRTSPPHRSAPWGPEREALGFLLA